MLVFARVVHAGSFTRAARELGMPKSTVSRKVAELEERLRARLLQRTTRKLSLTDVGHTYYDYCARILSEVTDAERAVSNLQATPQGLLRITAPVNFAFLGPIVSDYLKRYPEVRLDLFCTGRTVDLIEERFDLGIRAGTLADSSLIARSLGSVSWFLVATAGYLKKHGRPRTAEDLKGRDCLLFGAGSSGGALQLANAQGQQLHFSLSSRLLTTDMDILLAAARAGLGIAVLPAYLCLDDLRAKRLERVLREWTTLSTPVHVVYPSTRHISVKVKSFIDHLQQHMTPPPWELGPTP